MSCLCHSKHQKVHKWITTQRSIWTYCRLCDPDITSNGPLSQQMVCPVIVTLRPLGDCSLLLNLVEAQHRLALLTSYLHSPHGVWLKQVQLARVKDSMNLTWIWAWEVDSNYLKIIMKTSCSCLKLWVTMEMSMI